MRRVSAELLAPKTRPLHVKLEGMLELMEHSLLCSFGVDTRSSLVRQLKSLARSFG